MKHRPSILAFVSALVLLSIQSHEACRSFPRDNHLLLPSLQWKAVPPPKSNPGTNDVVNSANNLGEKNFVAATETRGSLKKHLLLPSLWRPVTPPQSNSAKNFAAAGLRPRKTSTHDLLLPSLKWRPVTSPSTNPGHNGVSTVGEQNFSGGKMTTIHPPPSSKHRSQQLPAESHHKAAS